jgi:flagellar protein FlaJ
MESKIPLLLISVKTMRRIGRRFSVIGRPISKLQPKLGEILPKIGVDLPPESYAFGALLSSFVYGLLIFLISYAALYTRQQSTFETTLDPNIAFVIGIAFWLIFLLLHLIYPSIILQKIATRESKDLLFALREVMVDVNSGIPLFDSMKNVAESNYGYTSQDFAWVVKQIESGVPEREALKNLALMTESEFMKRAVWQIVNALESGASLSTALPGIVQTLEKHIYDEIKKYSSNLNFLMLLYMLAAAAVPSLGVTFLVLLSAFGDFGVTVETVGLLVAGSALVQIAMIGYMSSTRPEIFGG